MGAKWTKANRRHKAKRETRGLFWYLKHSVMIRPSNFFLADYMRNMRRVQSEKIILMSNKAAKALKSLANQHNK